MNHSLLSPIYQQNASTGVWHRPEFVSIPYSDGADIEKQIAEIIRQARDLSVFSPELSGQCSNWPTLYHLSGSRANLLRPFEKKLKQADVLEIGAGCGALTRYLGEAGARVMALEGSLARAAIARSRSRDLANVTVLAEDFKAFETSARFDVVTLIGVLEYAPLFFPGENPVRTMLERAGMFLKPGGRLILAIENKLGLKYFAGAPEDHLGLPMYGIENRYRANEPHTFGQAELRALLEQAGFARIEFMFPFPDYKLPATILTESGLACKEFDSGSLIRKTAMQDPQLPGTLVFSPLLAWPSITHNGLVDELSNSFLVEARLNGPSQSTPPSPLAWHYSTRRAPEYCKETTFRLESQTQAIAVHSRPLGDNPVETQGRETIKWSPAPVTKYVHGHLLSDAFIDGLSRNDWRVESLTPLFKKYLDILTAAAAEKGSAVALHALNAQLPGSMWGLTPQNIIIDSCGNWHAFDQEWSIQNSIDLGWLLIRALLHLLQSIVQIGRCADEGVVTRADLIETMCQGAGLQTSREQIEAYVECELAVQTLISCRTGNPPQPAATVLAEPLNRRSVFASIQALQSEVTDAQHALTEKDARIFVLDRQIVELRTSLSWKLTAPMRLVRQVGLSGIGIMGTCRRAAKEYGVIGAVKRACTAMRLHGRQAVLHQIAYTRQKMPTGVSSGASPVSHAHSPLLASHVESTRSNDFSFYGTTTNEQRCACVLNPDEPFRLGAANKKGLSVLILNLNHPELIIPLCDQLMAEQKAFEKVGLPFEVLIGDTGTTNKNVLAYYKANARRLRLFPALNYHFSKNNNLLAREAHCDTLLFLNNDVILPRHTSSESTESPLLSLYRELQRDSKVGIVGTYLYFKDSGIQHAGIDFLRSSELRGFCYHPRKQEQVDPASWSRVLSVPAVTGACMMVKAKLFEQCGGLSEAYRSECQDVDLCLRAQRLGATVGIVNAGTFVHLENGTRPKKDENQADRQLFMRRWKTFIEAAFLQGPT